GPPSTPEDVRLANVLLAQSPRTGELESAIKTFTVARERIESRIRSSSRLAPAVWDANGVDEQVFIRGSPQGLGARVPRPFPEALARTRPIEAGDGRGRVGL